MNEVTFRAMGTEWFITADVPGLAARAGGEVRRMERCLSRFDAGSALSELHRSRRATDPCLAEVVRVALGWREATRGVFDPTMGVLLRSYGYDRTFEEIEAPPVCPEDVRPEVVVEGEVVSLRGEGLLDLGGVAKGWAVDHVARWLAVHGARLALVDGGGDLRAVGGPWAVGVGDEDAVLLHGDAVATSSVQRRRWRAADGSEVHHLLDPRRGAPAAGTLVTAVVRAQQAVCADVLAKALIVAPEEIMGLLPKFRAAAMVRDADGAWWTTPGWEAG